MKILYSDPSDGSLFPARPDCTRQYNVERYERPGSILDDGQLDRQDIESHKSNPDVR